MAGETRELIDRLEPIIEKDYADRLRERYNRGRFNPVLKKNVEYIINNLTEKLIKNQIVIHPTPERWKVGGEYSIGRCRYGKYTMNARFGLRGQDFIKHVGIFGSTGSGKTTTGHRLIKALCERGDPFLILDPKATWHTIIRRPWAKNVKVLQLGENYTFDPFMLLPGMDPDTLIAEVVEVFCDSQYLGYGAKNLLQRACYMGKDSLSINSVWDQFQRIEPANAKEKLWYPSTQRALETATSGILGRVFNHSDNISFDKLMKSQVVILMDKLADDDQKAIFMGLLLARIFWYRKLARVREVFKHLLVMEEFHILADAERLKGKSRIESLVRTCREFGQGVMIIDQNPGKIADAILGNLNTVISMNLGNSKDINAVGTAMALEPDIKRYLGRLEVGEAICRVKDRLKDPVLVKVDSPEDVRKTEPTPEEILVHNGDFVEFVSQQSKIFKSVLRKEFSHIPREDKLTPLHRKILRYLKINNGANLKSTFISHGLSYRRGNKIRNMLGSLDLIVSEKVSTKIGHETRLFLTEKGHRYLENTEDSRRLGGKWHRDAVEVIAKYNETRGFVVRREWKDADVFVDMGSGTKIYEIESLDRSKDYVHAVSNAVKSLLRADSVEVIVKDRGKKKKILHELRNSPAKNQLARLKIRLLSEYLCPRGI